MPLRMQLPKRQGVERVSRSCNGETGVKVPKHFLPASAADSVISFKITRLTSTKRDVPQQHDDPAKLLCYLIFAGTCT